MSFDCPECGFKNSEVQPAGEIQQRGVKYTLKVNSADDLSRQVVKSDTCVFRVEDIDLEIPPGRGQLTNVEGILSMVADDLGKKQEERKEKVPELYEKIEEVIGTLKAMASGSKTPFTLTIDDSAGNSWIEPSTSDKDGKYLKNAYDRTPAQNAVLGIGDGVEPPSHDHAHTNGTTEAPNGVRPEYHASHMVPSMPSDPGVPNIDGLDSADGDEIVENQVYSFPAACPGCAAQEGCTTNMKMVSIPHFKQVVIMSTVCERCGYRSNEVKTGGAVPEKGRRITVNILGSEDLSRDILKAESCKMSCPELSLSVEAGTLGGRFTTIEGLLTQVRGDLRSQIFDVQGGGDSMASDAKVKWDEFFGQLDKAVNGETPFTVVLEDPLAGSYVQSLNDDGTPDARMNIEEYDRTEEEEEELGLKDIKTEGYEQDEKDDDDDVEEQRRKASEVLAQATGNMSLEE